MTSASPGRPAGGEDLAADERGAAEEERHGGAEGDVAGAEAEQVEQRAVAPHSPQRERGEEAVRDEEQDKDGRLAQHRGREAVPDDAEDDREDQRRNERIHVV